MSTDKKSGLNLDNARKKEQISTMKKIIDDGVCPFCPKYLEKYHTKPILFKTNSWTVTTNAWPYENTKHHFLMITNKHIKIPEQLSKAEWQELGEIEKKLKLKYKFKSATLMMRCGDPKYSGATVEHLHAHIVVAKGPKNIVMARVG